MNYKARRYAKRKGLPTNIQIVFPTRRGGGLGKMQNNAKYLAPKQNSEVNHGQAK